MSKEKNAKISEFQFTNPLVTEFSFLVNKNYRAGINTNMPIQYNCDQDRVGQFGAVKKLNMVIGDEESPFKINATIEANFSWSEKIPEDIALTLLNQNAVALLISYLRPLIAHITTDAGFAPLNLPYLDVR